MWLGNDGKLSIRRFLALVLSGNFVYNTHYVITTWELGKSYADAALLLGVEAGLIAALLSLTTYSNVIANKLNHQSE